MKRLAWMALSFFAALLVGACQSVPQGAGSQELAKNGDGYADMSVDQLAALMKDKDLILVNVHVPYEGEIPQTDLFIPYDQIQSHLDELPNKEAAIVLYCRSGGMSTVAAKVLAGQGYTDVMELDGGFSAWEAQGHDLLHKG
jgi:rhodanese-related sulfurtransferase